MRQSLGFLLVPGFSLMSYAAAVEPLRAANVLSGRPLYRWAHIALEGGAAEASSQATILAEHRVGEPLALDLLLVCAGGNPSAFDHPPTLAWLRRLARTGCQLGGVSGGPYILARAGLLDGYRCTVHWEHAPAFAEEFPQIRLTRTLYEIDRDRLTCAGGIAALDLMRALIGADHGEALAAQVGDWFLQGQARLGSGPQRQGARERYGVSHPKLLAVLTLMERQLEAPLSRAALARHGGLSVRQLERLFRDHLGSTIAQHYLGLRLDHARRLLRQTALPVLEVAVASGFVSASHFSRSFRLRFGHGPRAEREARP